MATAAASLDSFAVLKQRAIEMGATAEELEIMAHQFAALLELWKLSARKDSPARSAFLWQKFNGDLNEI